MTSYGQNLDTNVVKSNEYQRKSFWYVPSQQGEYVVDLDLAARQRPLIFKIDHVNSTTVTSNKIEFFSTKSNIFPVSWNVFDEDTPGATEKAEFKYEQDGAYHRWRWIVSDTSTPPANLPATKRKMVIEFSQAGEALTWVGP